MIADVANNITTEEQLLIDAAKVSIIEKNIELGEYSDLGLCNEDLEKEVLSGDIAIYILEGTQTLDSDTRKCLIGIVSDLAANQNLTCQGTGWGFISIGNTNTTCNQWQIL